MPGSAFERAFENAARSEPKLLSAAPGHVAAYGIATEPGAVPWHRRKSSRIGAAALAALVLGALLLFSCEPTARVKGSSEAGANAGGKAGAKAGGRTGSKDDGQSASRGVTGQAVIAPDQGLGRLRFNGNSLIFPSTLGGSEASGGSGPFSFTPPGTEVSPRPAPSPTPTPAPSPNGTARPDASSSL